MQNITFLVTPDSRSSWPQNQTVLVVIAVVKRETHQLINFKNWIIKSLCMKLGLIQLLIKYHQLADQLEELHPRQAQAQPVEAHTFPHQQQLFLLHTILVEIMEGLCRMSLQKWQHHHSLNSIHQLEMGVIQLKSQDIKATLYHLHRLQTLQWNDHRSIKKSIITTSLVQGQLVIMKDYISRDIFL